MKTMFKAFSIFVVLALMLAALPGVTGWQVHALSADIVISQVYGGGGNSGATYTHDFIELFNRGTAPVSLSGWSVQYSSSGVYRSKFWFRNEPNHSLVWFACTGPVFIDPRSSGNGWHNCIANS